MNPDPPQSEPTHQVLLVDDNPTNLQVLYQALEQQGHELLIAQSGEEALDIARAAHPALVLLDINMPGMDGFETCRRLKEDPDTRESVVIFLSARNQVEDKVKGLRLGAVDYVGKPFQFEEVVARVNTQLELRRVREELRATRDQADQLLLNILPASIAERLKAGERNPVDSFPDATILFCDLVGFTPLAAQRPPDEIVHLLNQVFSAIDALVLAHHLEKIKTIGDAYLVAGGLPDPLPDHAAAVCDFALDLQRHSLRMRATTDPAIRLRIGVHTGPVVAGVIGERKFAYDLWGDAVNTASRMETTGEPDRIHVSAATRDRVADRFDFEARGEIDIKGKGRMMTYFLNGRRTESG